MRLSKIIGVVVVLTVGLIGCASKEKTEEKEVVIWHWMNDRKDAFDELSRKYTLHTGIPVKFKLFFPPDIYSQKVIAAARAGNLPEIFGILGEKQSLGSFIKAGHILDLSPYMKENSAEWENRFYPQTLQTTEFKKKNSYDVPPGLYGVPIDTTLMQFVYNKNLFNQAGLDSNNPPQTFEEFVSYAQTIKNKLGVDGFICGWGEGWLLNCLSTEWAINIMGEEKFIRTIEGKIPYTDAGWIRVFSLFGALRAADVLSADITTMINKEAEDLFSKEKAAMAFNGSWSVNVYKQLAPDLDYAFFSLPRASNTAFKVWGGAGSSFMVNAKSANKNEAVKFLKWLTAEEQQKALIKETNNLPSIKNCEQDLPPILSSIMHNLDRITHPNIWPYNEDSRVLEVMNKNLQQIVMGIKTPQEAAQEIQEIKLRVLKK